MAGRTLTVYLAADTTRFRRGMNRAADSVDGPTGLRGRIGNLSSTLNANLGPAMLGAGLAAGALAFTLGKDGVIAAADQQEKLAILDGTLDKMGFSEQKDEAREFIDQMARLTTFGDEELIGPLGTLTNAIGGPDGLTKAMETLPTLLDASVVTGRPLPEIVNAVAKAANGNTTALSRMFPWLDKNTLKTGDLDTATGLLAERFDGQATEATKTWKGQLGETTEAFGELQEAFGEGFLAGLSDAEGGSRDLQTALYDLQPQMKDVGEAVGDGAIEAVKLADGFIDINTRMTEWRESIADTNWDLIFKPIEAAMLGPLATAKDLIASLLTIKQMDQTITATYGGGSETPWGTWETPVGDRPSPSTDRSITVNNVKIEAGVGDPVAIAKQVNRVLAQGAARKGGGR